MASKRLTKEFEASQSSNHSELFADVQLVNDNLFAWEAILLPLQAPYNKGAFKVSLTFPTDYPFKAPKVVFQSKIYHPNVDANGIACLDILKAEAWKPTVKVEDVLLSLVMLIDEPNTNDPLNVEAAKLFTEDKKKFVKTCEEWVKKHALPRP